MRPLERLTAGYLAVAAGLVALGPGPVRGRAALLTGFLGCLVLVLACAALARHRPKSRPVACVSLCCPLVLTLFLYPAVGRYALVLRGRFVDDDVNAWERRLFGGHPNLVLDGFASPPLTEFMMASYFSFYLFAALPPLWLIFRDRTEDAADYLLLQMSAVYLCYLGFLLVPLRGPVAALGDAFSSTSLAGYVMTDVQALIMVHDPVGACFPSAHVATAWAGLLAMRRIISVKAFHAFLPLVLCVTVSVVYNRYHYLSDALAGMAVAFFSAALAPRLAPRSFPSYRSSPRGYLRQMP
ncbi:phosphatase PAP2 family protein [Streptomyces yerevanensis]|uniref:phosphatase PAP2 family protein n=1 Tax=Streptomyces yerevanensis TaxID=66378 RepID=UPI0006894B1F|nr:phosphatase PAP2 family protein [Streptomyces yerevanensis]